MKGEICFQSGKSSQHASGKSTARQDHPASVSRTAGCETKDADRDADAATGKEA